MRVDDLFNEIQRDLDTAIKKDKEKLKSIEQQDGHDEGYGPFIRYERPFIKLEKVRESVVNMVERIIGNIQSNNNIKSAVDNVRFLVHQEVFSLILTKEQANLLKNLFQSELAIHPRMFAAAAWLNSLLITTKPAPPLPPAQ